MFGLVCLLIMAQARADAWTSTLTLTGAHAENSSGTLLVRISTSQAVSNPAGCSAPDAYVVSDPVIVNQIYATALTALATGSPVEIYVSGSQCTVNRPTILTMQILSN